MTKYIFLILFIISIIACLYYFYASIINKKLNNKKLYIGEDASRNRYTMKTSLSVSCVIGTFGLFMFTMFYVPNVSLMNEFSNEDDFNVLFNENNNVYTLISLKNKNHKFDYEYAKSARNNLYVITNDKVIKYDMEKEINKFYVFDDYANEESIYVANDKIIAYTEYNNYSSVYVFDLNLNLIEKFNINSLLKYINVNNDTLNLICDINIKDNLKIINLNNDVDLLDYSELLYNINSINNVVVHTSINLNDFTVTQKGLCVNEVNYVLDDYLYVITNKHNANNLYINELYQYDLLNMEVINIKEGAGKVVDIKNINSNNNISTNIIITLNFGDNVNREYLIKYDKHLELSLNDSLDHSVLEETVFDIYLSIYNSNGQNVKIVSCDDLNVYIYCIIKENNVYTYLKLTDDYKVTYKERVVDKYLAYTNKYLITYDYNEITNVKVINDSIGE